MSKQAVFTMKLEPELRTRFMAAAEAAHRPASQVLRELMREFVQRQGETKESSEFLKGDTDAEKKLITTLDLMTHHLLAGNGIQFSDCVLDWFRNGFQCNQVPMPTDKNPVHLAVKASIVDRLVEVLNAPPHLDNQTAPSWCDQIKALDTPLRLQSDRLLEGEPYCSAFAKRNLHVAQNFMYFV